MSSAHAVRFKVQIKLCIQKLRTVNAKKEAMNKKERRTIASLLEKSKVETAAYRVETIVNEEILIELLEVLELYCELCTARFGLIEQSRDIDPAIQEAVAGILHASPKTDIKELHTLSNLFMNHYGREFGLKCIENKDDIVPKRITDKLVIHTPSKELVDLYLFEIAKAYGVQWEPDAPSKPEREPLGEASFGAQLEETAEEREALSKLPSTQPPDPSEADHTVVIKDLSASPPKSVVSPSTGKSKEDDEYEAMQKRFAALTALKKK